MLRQRSVSTSVVRVLEALWSPESMANCIVTVEYRLEQMATLVCDFKTAAQGLFATMWPKKEVPSSTFALTDHFTSSPDAVYGWMKSVARAGAGAALAFLRAHHPDGDLKKITSGGPLNPSDNMVDPLTLLDQVRPAASRVMGCVNLWECVKAAPGEESEEE